METTSPNKRHVGQRLLRETVSGFLELRSAQLSRYAFGRRLRYCTMEQLIRWSDEWAHQLPAQADLVVGMPRSGFLVAQRIAQQRRLPLTTPDLLTSGSAWRNGVLQRIGTFQHALLIDDSIHTGTQIKEALKELRIHFPEKRFETAVLLPHQRSHTKCDHYARIFRAPRIFEWDVMHTKKYSPIGFDFDGVLCEDCDPLVDQDEASYRRFLREARPKLIPHYKIDFIISNRLEKYRRECEEWLERHKVRFGQLILWDLSSKEARRNLFSRNKINQVFRCRPRLFVESSFNQSRQIALRTGIPVLCTDRNCLFS